MLTIHQQFVKLNTEKEIIEFSNVVSHYSSWFNFQLKENIKIGHSVSFHFIFKHLKALARNTPLRFVLSNKIRRNVMRCLLLCLIKLF